MKKYTIGFIPRYNKENPNTLTVLDDYKTYFISNNHNVIILKPESLKEQLPMCDAIIGTGGVDVSPSMYNEQVTYSVDCNKELDELDYNVISYCIVNKVPYLGICRGMQVLNVVLGGTLYQDIDKEFNNQVPLDENVHNVFKMNNYNLSTLLPLSFEVNHFHHQGIKDLSSSLIPLYEFNGLIEAVEHVSLPLIGVQWHPEKIDSVYSTIIFEYLLSKII